MLRPLKCSRNPVPSAAGWRIAPIALLLAAVSGCASPGPPVLGPLFADPDSLAKVRAGRLVERPRWIEGPDNIDFALYARAKATQRSTRGADSAAAGAVAYWPDRPAHLECVITAAAQLSLCGPYIGLRDLSPEEVKPYLAAMHLAMSMQLAPLDLDGQPVAGGRVRFTLDWPEEEPVPSEDEITLPRILNPPSPFEVARFYPANALERGLDGDVILICVVAASGLSEGCEVFFESVSGVGFGEASQQAYRNIRILPPTVNGEPRRAMAMATVRWRLQ